MPADNELTAKLTRRLDRNEALEQGQQVTNTYRTTGISIYSEFSEFSRKQIKEYEKAFKKYDAGGDGYLDLEELKVTMERLAAPQTHLSLKAMIKEVDEDQDGKLSFREFLLVFRKAAAGELPEDSGLCRLAALTDIDVGQVGVNGAANFFESKIEELTKTSKFEAEIREEQEMKKRELELKKLRRAEFKEKASLFSQQN
ncbi:hypothetical protein GHT06_018745 [Daphnia sinensis]|uniref:EF-hand domain-containing protein n=1 Tax=Daphnia sinensis TaxID=1820382 RepID=A0AAD5PQI8_9CRUS|nr:hypothetical protein GHT06_018745 [Daphnia sinensis]